MAVKIAMYIGKGKIGNAVIRSWTDEQESHCELVVEGLAYSSSLMDNGVRKKYIDFDSGNWYLVEIPWATSEQVIEHYEKTKNNKYGWWSLVTSQVLNRNKDESRADFCSEWCARALGLPSPNTYSPGTLAKMITFLNEFKGNQ